MASNDPFAPEVEVEEFEFDLTGVESKNAGAGFLPAGRWLCELVRWETGKAGTGTSKVDWYFRAVPWSGNKDQAGKTTRLTSYITDKTKPYFRGTLETIGIPVVAKNGMEKAQFSEKAKGSLVFVIVQDEEGVVIKEDGTKETKVFTKAQFVEKVPGDVRASYLRENGVTA